MFPFQIFFLLAVVNCKRYEILDELIEIENQLPKNESQSENDTSEKINNGPGKK